ncbi:MAG: diaminopimelate epimerase [Rhizomicrobium sp.]|jgi:diaminopimelate epimerase
MTAFLKLHGLGNDFVVFDARKRPISLSPAGASAIADRRLGVGCDQVIVIESSANGADALMRIYNADGSEVESCGNAARCVAQMLMDESRRDSVRLDTEGGVLVCRRIGSVISVDMGPPRLSWRDIPLSQDLNTKLFVVPIVGGELHDAAAVSMGNPHCVLFVEKVEGAAVQIIGPAVECARIFPERTNVEFVQVLSPEKLRVRVWERGTGVTLACGTGACAAMVAANRRGLCGSRAEVLLDGGPLTIEWQGDDSHVVMTGPAALVYRGEIDLRALG